MNAWKTCKEFFIITLGTAIIAVAVYFFMMPSHMSLGSVAGLSIVLQNFLPLKVSAIAMIVNASLLVLGFLLVGREFGVKTVYTSLLLPAMLSLLELLFPGNPSLTKDAFTDMICYLFVVSLGQSILFASNASSGGLDIVGKLMNRYLHMDIGRSISIAGMCIAVSSALVYDSKTVVLSILGTYLNGIVLDYFIFGSTIKRRVCILSRKQEEILNFILNRLHSGATVYEAIGAYDRRIQQEIVAIVDKSEYHQLMNYLSQADPDAFVTVYHVNHIIYKPKPHPAKPPKGRRKPLA
ncbi:YitT family protein [Cuneatibacter sp. NSJ-177]|uniref:YitT family protein n=1 Tax=Cuneatibacter sp. NSJ-177 TaxID=2931401 RepID=UPI001FD29F86|nr:YitT family protein [Cuneatibacter sp. NSJ-177]MCJ7837509.1 YitT family protein [Cuneatibacter sp. NSJ-177]